VTLEMVATLGGEAMWTAWSVGGPVLIAGLAVGVIISIFQAVTQINEMTLTFIPKIIVAGLAVALNYDRMIQVLLTFTKHVFTDWGEFLR
jgi:flagellar biosynthesis protein FliQ